MVYQLGNSSCSLERNNIFSTESYVIKQAKTLEAWKENNNKVTFMFLYLVGSYLLNASL